MPTLCLCGCGQEVRPGRKYASWDHWNRSKHTSGRSSRLEERIAALEAMMARVVEELGLADGPPPPLPFVDEPAEPPTDPEAARARLQALKESLR